MRPVIVPLSRLTLIAKLRTIAHPGCAGRRRLRSTGNSPCGPQNARGEVAAVSPAAASTASPRISGRMNGRPLTLSYRNRTRCARAAWATPRSRSRLSFTHSTNRSGKAMSFAKWSKLRYQMSRRKLASNRQVEDRGSGWLGAFRRTRSSQVPTVRCCCVKFVAVATARVRGTRGCVCVVGWRRQRGGFRTPRSCLRP